MNTSFLARAQAAPGLVAIFAMAFVVVGAKLILVDLYGADIPFWDQWDAEAAHLYRPYLEDRLTFWSFFAPHNEHRIATTRLVALSLFELNGVWFPSLQMAVNAFLHVGVLGIVVWVLSRTLTPAATVGLALAAAALLVIPFGWENTLGAFQTQFYFVFGFSIIALVLTTPAEAFSRRWWGGIAVGVVAFFSMSSGALVFAAMAFVSLLQIAVGARDRSAREGGAVVLAIAILAALIVFTPSIGYHDSIRAQSFGQLVRAFFLATAWPFSNAAATAWPVGEGNTLGHSTGSLVLRMLIVNLPIIALAIRVLTIAPPLRDRTWLVIAVAGWLGTQWISFAYGRGAHPIQTRYLDTLALGPILNLAALLVLILQVPRYARALAAIGLVWGAVLVYALAQEDVGAAFDGAANRSTIYGHQITNVTAFLATGDQSHLENKDFWHIPYPYSGRLGALLRNETIQSMLHPDLTGRPVTAEFLTPAPVQKLFRGGLIVLSRSGPVWIVLGLLGFALALFSLRKRPRPA